MPCIAAEGTVTVKLLEDVQLFGSVGCKRVSRTPACEVASNKLFVVALW